MKNMYLILSVLFLFTGCNEEEAETTRRIHIYGTGQYNNSQTDSLLTVILGIGN